MKNQTSIEQFEDGSPCASCERGLLVVEARTFDRRRPGLTKLHFRCSECGQTTTQWRDLRFDD